MLHTAQNPLLPERNNQKFQFIAGDNQPTEQSCNIAKFLNPLPLKRPTL